MLGWRWTSCLSKRQRGLAVGSCVLHWFTVSSPSHTLYVVISDLTRSVFVTVCYSLPSNAALYYKVEMHLLDPLMIANAIRE